ncbi:hypothetical protein RI367_000358 [Sorochytrium milnesiophthora]
MSQLFLTVCEAKNLKNRDMFGKMDPYLRAGYDFRSQESMRHTKTVRSGGRDPTWDEVLQFPYDGYRRELFIEVYDEDPTTDDLIGVAAIPLDDLHRAGEYGAVHAWYAIYGVASGHVHGEVRLALSRNMGGAATQHAPVRGNSFMNPEHAKHCKSNNFKKSMMGVGAAGAVALGAGLLANYVSGQHKEEEERKRREQEEEMRRRQEQEAEERRRREQEEEERRRREQQQQQQQYGQQQQQYGQYGGEGQHQHHGEHHKHHHNQEAREWDPVGTYNAGERVYYNGRTWECLQYHTSNPTWQPPVAVSLWRAM